MVQNPAGPPIGLSASTTIISDESYAYELGIVSMLIDSASRDTREVNESIGMGE